jgi:hypothetical protein
MNVRDAPWTDHIPATGGTKVGMGAPRRTGPESKIFIRVPVVTPLAPALGATATTLGRGTAVVVVTRAVVEVERATVVEAAAVVGTAIGGGAGVREPRASRCLCPAAVLADTSPPVATSAKSAVAATAAR